MSIAFMYFIIILQSSGNGVVLTAFRNGIQNCTSLKSLSLGGYVPMKVWELPADMTGHVITTIALCRGLDRIELKRSTFSKSSICLCDQSSKAMYNLVLHGVERWERWHRGGLWKKVHSFTLAILKRNSLYSLCTPRV